MERFEYIGDDIPGLKSIRLSYDPSKNEGKFPNLKYIKIEFRITIFESESPTLVAKIEKLEKFKNYLSTKCPKLENPIQLDLKKKKIALDVGSHIRYDKATFESK